jgi:hypothetical protein
LPHPKACGAASCRSPANAGDARDRAACTAPVGRAEPAGCTSTYPDTATQARRTAGTEPDLHRHLLAHALLAPMVLREAGSAQPDPLFEQIPRRHTDKSAYVNDRALPAPLTAHWAQTAQRFGLLGGVVADTDGVDRLRAITREADRIERVPRAPGSNRRT